MKKIFVLFLCFSLSGCAVKDNNIDVEETLETNIIIESEEEPSEPSTELTTDQDIEWELPIEDNFYNAEEYGYTEVIEQYYLNDLGQEGCYYQLDCYYFSEDVDSEKYSLVNQTLQNIYNEKEVEYRIYCEDNIQYFELDESIANENQRKDYVKWFLVSVPYVGEDYVSLLFNDMVYYAGAAHALTYFTPITISVETGEIVTAEEIVNKSWPEICATVGMNELDEQEFVEEYGFYITDRTLTYKYRTNEFVEEIVIER